MRTLLYLLILLLTLASTVTAGKGPPVGPAPTQPPSQTPLQGTATSDTSNDTMTTDAEMVTEPSPKSNAQEKNKQSATNQETATYIDEHERLLIQVNNNLSVSAVRPLFGGDPINVTCSITVVAIDTLSERTMDYSMSLSLYLEWNDPRLTHNSSGEIVFQTVETIKRFWLPDVYFVNEKNGMFHKIISENIVLIVKTTGDVIYSMRLGLTLTCYMDLNYFPMDRQECPISMRSYAYNNDNLRLKWRTKVDEDDPPGIDYNDQIRMPQFNLIDMAADTEEKKLRLGNFTTLTARFTLERVMGFYIVHTFLPSFLLVMLSWITFWLHVDATAARASLGITTVLTVTTQVSSSRFTLPEVSYPTALDVWFSGCLMFVFSALLEFAFVNYVYLLDVRVRPLKRSGTKTSMMTVEQLSMDVCNNASLAENYKPSKDIMDKLPQSKYNVSKAARASNGSFQASGKIFKPYVQYARSIDRVARVMFPLLFLLFNIIFWVVYLKGREVDPEEWGQSVG